MLQPQFLQKTSISFFIPVYLVGYMFYPSKGTIETRKLKGKERVRLYW